jgi:hypothetical protein
VATHPRINIRPVKTLNGTATPRQNFPEALSQTFEVGSPVVLNSSGYLVECSANPPLIMGVASRDGQNGSANGSKDQAVYLAHPDTLFVGNMDNGGTEDSGVGLASDRGKMYGITKHASNGTWYVDKNKAAAATRRVVVWDLWDEIISTNTGGATEPAWTDTIPRVVFAFDPAFYQGNKTS